MYPYICTEASLPTKFLSQKLIFLGNLTKTMKIPVLEKFKLYGMLLAIAT